MHRTYHRLVSVGERQVVSGRDGNRDRSAAQTRRLFVQQLPGAVGCRGLRVHEVRVFGEQRGAGVTRRDVGMRDDGMQLVEVGADTSDLKSLDRLPGASHGLRVSGSRRADQFCEQWIETRIGCISRIATAIHADPGSGGITIGADDARGGDHDSRLDGKAGSPDCRLIAKTQFPEGVASCQVELGGDEVHSGHFLGNRVLYLQARVALDEVVRILLRSDQKLDRTRVDVARCLHEAYGVVEYACSQIFTQIGRGCDFDHFLVSELHRAIALE